MRWNLKYSWINFVFFLTICQPLLANEGSERLQLKKKKSQFSIEMLFYIDSLLFDFENNKTKKDFSINFKSIESIWHELGALLPKKIELDGAEISASYKDKFNHISVNSLDDIGVLHNQYRNKITDLLQLEILPTYTPNKIQGRRIFEDYCSSCHGVKGDGYGKMRDQLPLKLSDLGQFNKQKYVSVGAIFNLLSAERYKGLMADYSDLLTNSELWSVSFYLKTLISYPQKNQSDFGQSTAFSLEDMARKSDYQLGLSVPLESFYYYRNVFSFQGSTPRS